MHGKFGQSLEKKDMKDKSRNLSMRQANQGPRPLRIVANIENNTIPFVCM